MRKRIPCQAASSGFSSTPVSAMPPSVSISTACRGWWDLPASATTLTVIGTTPTGRLRHPPQPPFSHYDIAYLPGTTLTYADPPRGSMAGTPSGNLRRLGAV